MYLSSWYALWTYQIAEISIITKMLTFPMSQVSSSEDVGEPRQEDLEGSRRVKVRVGWLAFSLHHIQCSDEALVGLPKHSQVNLTWGTILRCPLCREQWWPVNVNQRSLNRQERSTLLLGKWKDWTLQLLLLNTGDRSRRQKGRKERANHSSIPCQV